MMISFLGSYSMRCIFFLKDGMETSQNRMEWSAKIKKPRKKTRADEVITKATHEKRYENKTFLCVLFNDEEREHTI